MLFFGLLKQNAQLYFKNQFLRYFTKKYSQNAAYSLLIDSCGLYKMAFSEELMEIFEYGHEYSKAIDLCAKLKNRDF